MDETQSPSTTSSSNMKYIAIIGVIVILVIAAFVFASQNKQNQEVVMAPKESEPTTAVEPTTTTSTSTNEASLTGEPAAAGLKDGTYTAEGPYTVHVGPKTIKVTITLKDNIITESEVVNMADDPTSKKFQDIFIAEYKPLVEGKDITTVNLTKVASSSLTPQGFNAALRDIEQQAQL